jgi:hypothetical protein
MISMGATEIRRRRTRVEVEVTISTRRLTPCTAIIALPSREKRMTGACDGLESSTSHGGWRPLATMVLDNGAEVVKSTPSGDPARDLPAFQTWNRGKKSVVVDED